jgi:predicted double-glycine peptidase
MKHYIPLYKQKTDYTCGPAVLRMAIASLGVRKSEKYLSRICRTTAKNGTSNFGLKHALRKLGFSYVSEYRSTYSTLRSFLKKGIVIVDWMPQIIFPTHPDFVKSKEFDPKTDSHYAIVLSLGDSFVTLLDPIFGANFRISKKKFAKSWRDVRSHKIRWALSVLKP